MLIILNIQLNFKHFVYKPPKCSSSNLLSIGLNKSSKIWQRMNNLVIDNINLISISSFVSTLKFIQPTRLRWRLFLRWIKATTFIMEVRLGIDRNCILAIHALTFRPDTFSFSCYLCTLLASTYTIEKQYEWMKMNSCYITLRQLSLLKRKSFLIIYRILSDKDLQNKAIFD